MKILSPSVLQIYCQVRAAEESRMTAACCRKRLQETQEASVWDHEMRPVRNVLSRTCLKTRSLGMEISSILETDYILMGSDLQGGVHVIEEFFLLKIRPGNTNPTPWFFLTESFDFFSKPQRDRHSRRFYQLRLRQTNIHVNFFDPRLC